MDTKLTIKIVFQKFLSFSWHWVRFFIFLLLIKEIFFMFINPRCFYSVTPCETSFSYIDILLLVLPIFFAIYYPKFKNQFFEKILHFGMIFFGMIFFFVFLFVGLIIIFIKDFSSFSYPLLIGINFLILFTSLLISFLCFRFENEIISVVKPILKFVAIFMGSYLIIALPFMVITTSLSFFMPSFIEFYWRNISLFVGLILLSALILTIFYYKSTKLKKIFIPILSISVFFLIFLAVFIRNFIFSPLIFKGTELKPYLKDGQYILIQKIDKTPKRGEIVAFMSPEKEILLGMVFGLSGENIIVENGVLYINEKKLEEIKYSWDNCYFNEAFKIPSDSFLLVSTNISCPSPQFILSANIHKKAEIVGKIIKTPKEKILVPQLKKREQKTGAYEEKIITQFTKSDGNFFRLLNFKNTKDPAFEELLKFLQNDNTDDYNYEVNKFMCGEFAEILHNNAERNGIKTGLVIIEFSSTTTVHALNVFNTSDYGLVYVDVTGKNFVEIRKKYLEQKCDYDKIAYLQEGKSAGLISIDVPNIKPDYNFYERFSSNHKEFLTQLEKYEQRLIIYEQKVNRYNKEVDEYNDKAEKYTREVENYEKERNAYEERVKYFNEKVNEYNIRGIGDYNQLQIEEKELNQIRIKLDNWFEKLNAEKINLDKEKNILDEKKKPLDNEKQLLDIERETLINEEKKFGTCIWEPFPFGEVTKIHIFW